MERMKMVTYSKPWTWEEIKFVSDLASKGFSAKDISLELIDRTRNSVIGICHRKGIKLLQQEKRKQKFLHPLPKKKKSSVSKVTKFKQERLPTLNYFDIKEDENFTPLNKTLMDLNRGECKAIIGPIKNLETLYCGYKSVEGKSWCPHHFLKYTVPDRKRAA
jgi:hypothetical protein